VIPAVIDVVEVLPIYTNITNSLIYQHTHLPINRWTNNKQAEPIYTVSKPTAPSNPISASSKSQPTPIANRTTTTTRTTQPTPRSPIYNPQLSSYQQSNPHPVPQSIPSRLAYPTPYQPTPTAPDSVHPTPCPISDTVPCSDQQPLEAPTSHAH
jgi:hypothetical protein